MEEPARLREIGLYEELNDKSRLVLDELVELAASICETPISLVSIVDRDEQKFWARTGLEATSTPRDWAFCAHTIMEQDMLVVEDATRDERFAENPLVLSDPNIRFYAGAPIGMASGASLGSLCVIDRTPRVLTEPQRKALYVLRNAVVAHLEVSRAMRDLKSVEKMIPMCAWCRSVRQDSPEGEGEDEWMPLERYVARNGNVSHGVCPQCSALMLEEMQDR